MIELGLEFRLMVRGEVSVVVKVKDFDSSWDLGLRLGVMVEYLS